MKKVALPMLFTIVLLVGFIVGVFGSIPALSVPAFCLWSPAMFWLGWSSGRAGFRIILATDVQSPAPAPEPKSLLRQSRLG